MRPGSLTPASSSARTISTSPAGACCRRSCRQDDRHAQRRHRVADVVQDAARDLRGPGFERLIGDAAARVGQLVHHPVEFVRQDPEFVRTTHRHAQGQVVALADGNGVLRHPD